jgi:lysozyme
MTEQQASKILEQKFQGYYTAVKKSITVPVSESCLQAYASLAYNVGVKTVRESTSLRQLNEGNWRNASISFTWFNKGGGKVLPGLVKRREAEVAFWLRGMSDWDQNAIERYLDLLGI